MTNTYKINKNDKYYEIYNSNKLGNGICSLVCLGKMVNKINGETEIVAVKKIIKSLLSPKAMSMLVSEIDVITKTLTHNHNNIVKCYDVIDDIDVIYIVMEYCENGDLLDLLKGNPLKYKYIKYYFGQIVNALKYLNDKNIIHRDVKPKNILVTNNMNTIKLCDFGFAKHHDGIKRIMTICGSPLYMAPEIYNRKGYTMSVDVWSLGIILYEMLFGMHPLYNFNDPKKIVDSIINTDIIIPDYKQIYCDDIDDINDIDNIDDIDDIDEECITILKNMLQRNENKRITITELFSNEWVIKCMETTIDENINLSLIYRINKFDKSDKSKNSHNSHNSHNSNLSNESDKFNESSDLCKDENEFSFLFEMDE